MCWHLKFPAMPSLVGTDWSRAPLGQSFADGQSGHSEGENSVDTCSVALKAASARGAPFSLSCANKCV